jgi:hypothetical protein
MDHYSGAGARAGGFKDFNNQYYFGQRSTSVYVPVFKI